MAKPRKRDNLPARQGHNVTPARQETTVTVQKSEYYQGALPPASLLQQYDDVVPGAANRIVALIEAQTTHRIYIERSVVDGDRKRANWGLVSGTLVTLVCLGGSIYLIATGHDVAGAALGGTNIAAIASAFIIGTNSRRREREAKQQAAKIR